MAIKPIKPVIEVVGDREDKIMQKTGWIAGYQQGEFVLWCFGFLPGTPQALAYGVSVDRYTWALAKEDGTVIMQFKHHNELPIEWLPKLVKIMGGIN
jgi:hypothetical protein